MNMFNTPEFIYSHISLYAPHQIFWTNLWTQILINNFPSILGKSENLIFLINNFKISKKIRQRHAYCTGCSNNHGN